MTTTPSIKNVSPADLEKALARALEKLTGWPDVKVVLQAAQYVPQAGAGECVKMELQAWLHDSSAGAELPF